MWLFYTVNNNNTSTTHTPSLILFVSQQYESKETSTGTKWHTHTHTGSKSLLQTCKAKLIKGPLWLWWRRVRFPLTLHTAPLHKYLQAADWTRKEKKSNVFLFGSGLIPDGEMSWWKKSAGAFGQDGFAYHASELMHCWKCFGVFFLLFGMHAPKLAPHLWIRYKKGRQVLSSFHPSLHPLHFLPPRRCICILSSSCQCLTDTCTNPHSHLLRAVISMLTLCLRQHVFLPHCWPLVFMSVKHMQEC